MPENLTGFMQALYVFVEQNSIDATANQKDIDHKMTQNKHLMKCLAEKPIEENDPQVSRKQLSLAGEGAKGDYDALLSQVQEMRTRVESITKGMNKMQTKVQILTEWADERKHKVKQKKRQEQAQEQTQPIYTQIEDVK